MVCELTVPGDPQSKGRPRVYQGHGITPAKTREAENRVYSEYMDDRQIIEASVHVHRPDQYVLGTHGRPRKRKSGDPLTWHGQPYTPHTQASIYFKQEYIPR